MVAVSIDPINESARCHKDRSGKLHIKIIAIETIQKDEEITYGYGGNNLPWRQGKKPKRDNGKPTYADVLNPPGAETSVNQIPPD